MDSIKQCLLEKMNTYLFNNIFEYIPLKIPLKYLVNNNNIFDYFESITLNEFKLKLFKYSKLFQKKFDIDLNDYKYQSLSNKLDILNFRKITIEEETLKKMVEDRNFLCNDIEYYLKKVKKIDLSMSEIIDIIKKHFEKNKKAEKKIELNYILDKYYDIYSPFADIFFNYYDIDLRIPLSLIKKYNLIDDYISFFKNKKCDKLYIEFQEIKEIKILRKIGVDFSILKTFSIHQKNGSFSKKEEDEDISNSEKDNFHSEKNIINLEKKIFSFSSDSDSEEEISNINNKDQKYFDFDEIFSILKNSKNLESLTFKLYFYKPEDSYTNFFEPLNNLNNLTYIKFSGIILNNPFIISLTNLQNVYFTSCEYLNLDPEKTTKNIKYLELYWTDMFSDSKCKFDNLKTLVESNSSINIDYNSLKNLKSLETNNVDVIINTLKYSSVEEMVINNDVDDDNSEKEGYFTLEEEMNIFESILKNKTLKKIKLSFYKITNEELKKCKKCTNLLNELTFYNKKNNFDYTYFLNKFSGVKKLKIDNNYSERFFSELQENQKDKCIEVKNDENIFIEHIVINAISNITISFSFSKIKILELYGELKYESFSLINESCADIFSSLESLNIFPLKNMPSYNNLAKNIKHCKNLKKLYIPIHEELLIEFNQNSILELANKFLTLKLSYLILTNYNPYRVYTIEELKKLFPNKLLPDIIYIPKIK